MGNWCCGLHNHNQTSFSSSSMVWAAHDHWLDTLSDSISSIPNNKKQLEKQSLLDGLDDDHNNDSSSSSSSQSSFSSSPANSNTHREVKIKISKKQLQELLATSGDNHVILSHLLTFKPSTDHNQMNIFNHQRSANWMPLLQTIPEQP